MSGPVPAAHRSMRTEGCTQSMKHSRGRISNDITPCLVSVVDISYREYPIEIIYTCRPVPRCRTYGFSFTRSLGTFPRVICLALRPIHRINMRKSGRSGPQRRRACLSQSICTHNIRLYILGTYICMYMYSADEYNADNMWIHAMQPSTSPSCLTTDRKTPFFRLRAARVQPLLPLRRPSRAASPPPHPQGCLHSS